jgi:hypothetical protein
MGADLAYVGVELVEALGLKLRHFFEDRGSLVAPLGDACA